MILIKRVAVLAGAVTALTLTMAAPASAHVSVSSASAVQGGFAKVTFRAPTESDTASTTKIEVTLPKEAPLAFVSVKPIPGWTVAAVKEKLAKPIESHGSQITEAVSKITWTAGAGAGVKPGEFQEFDVSVGPLPEADQIVFKALQTYSDGTVVRWIDEPVAGGAEAEHPAPVLKLAKKAAAEGAAPVAAAAAAPAAPADQDEGTNALGIGGLVLGVLALIVALLAFRRAGGAPAATTAPAASKD